MNPARGDLALLAGTFNQWNEENQPKISELEQEAELHSARSLNPFYGRF